MITLAFASAAQATRVSMPTIVNSYPALTTTQMNVAKAYLSLLGRAPDKGGLDYWSTHPSMPANATLIQAANLIARNVGGNLVPPVTSIFDPASNNFTNPTIQANWGGWDEFVEYMYVFILGKAVGDDYTGVQYWQNQVHSGVFTTPGDLIQALYNAADVTAPADGGDKFHNKITMLEAVARLEEGRNRSLQNQDTQTIIRRVTDTTSSFNDAFTLADSLTNGGTNVAGPRWETPVSGSYTPTKVMSESIALTPSGFGNVHKYIVWYNRSGRMMLANVFLPPNYSTGGALYKAIVSVHGGGWAGGFVEKMQEYNQALASNQSGTPYVVFSPAYSLTPYVYSSPEQQNDIEDFVTLVKSSVTMNSFWVDTSNVNLFGLSSGGHLVNLLGSLKDVGKIAALYPVSDLGTCTTTSCPNYDALNVGHETSLIPYIQKYVNSTAVQTNASVSPTWAWTSARTSKFFILHGNGDKTVPYGQSQAFTDRVNSNSINSKLCQVGTGTPTSATAAGHGFYSEYAGSPQSTPRFTQTVSLLVNYFNSGLFPVTCPAY
ncbi:alpha/beta hydrolase [Undibacterium terreum]|nr:alpha/beta hydrolase [Undibacterium terreum]